MVTALVVEDSLTDRENLINHLHNLKIMVISVGSSEEALFKIESTKPDVIFLDVVLPGQSGFEFCRNLKTDQKTQDIPIIIYSTKDTDADKLWGSMLGADAYLSKPVNAEQLTQVIKHIVG
ncbi:MAG: PleD family two-component system response regulator [Leptolyngbyaceae cyanobacterium]